MNFGSSEATKELNQNRARYAFSFLIFFFLIIFLRLWYLQILQGKKFRTFSQKNSIKERTIYAPRGPILDRNGKVLVGNIPGYRLALEPSTFRRKNKERYKEVIDYISTILDEDPEGVSARTKRNFSKTGAFNPGLVKNQISNKQALTLKQSRIDFPEIIVEEVIFRDYPLSESAAQIFGYVSHATKNQMKNNRSFLVPGDQVGQAGIENKLDRMIRGKDGISYVQVDARGRVQKAENSLISYMGLSKVDPKIGNTVVLTLDKDIQTAAYEAFKRDDKYGLRKGGLVALNMQGEVLAWTSMPSFDPTLFQTGISSEMWKSLNTHSFKPLTDKVAQGTYMPGSVFKPLVGLASLHHGEITKDTRVEAPGYIFFGGRRWHDHRASGHGFVNVEEALEVSSNVFFYKLGMQLGVDKLTDVISRLGLGNKTGIKYVEESKGLLPNTKWKKENVKKEPRWQRGEDLNYAIGQGYTNISVLQLAKSYLSIASKGKVYSPYLIKEVLSPKGKTILESKPNLEEDLTTEESLSIDPKHFDTIIRGLIRVAHGKKGTARYRSSKRFLMAGKTGTAQVKRFSANDIYKKCEELPIKDRHHGLFVGFAPAEKPEIVVAALALHACHGSSGAAPMVTDVLRAYMKKHHPELFLKDKKVAKNSTKYKKETF